MKSSLELISLNDVESSAFLFYRTQIEIVKQWNNKFNWGFTEGDFYALGEPPKIPKKLTRPGKFYAIVLDIKFENIEETFNNFWQAVLSAQPKSYKWKGLEPDLSHLYTTEGLNHKPGLSWKIIEINANRGDSVDDLKTYKSLSPNRFASSSVLWMVAYFIKWAEDNYGSALSSLFIPRHYLCVPGYKVKLPNKKHYTDTLFMHWDFNDGNLALDVANSGFKNEKWIIPTILKN